MQIRQRKHRLWIWPWQEVWEFSRKGRKRSEKMLRRKALSLLLVRRPKRKWTAQST
jgi:hypothetical protein